MPSNRTYVCVPCRIARKHSGVVCERCGGPLVEKYKWSAPKRTNDRAWKRIENGDWFWDHRKTRKSRGPDLVLKFDTIKIPVELIDWQGNPVIVYRTERVPGSGRYETNYRRLPDIDLGR